MKWLFNVFCILGILYFLPVSVFASTDLIPADRQIDWTKAGIPGGIPHRTTICTTLTTAAYGNGTTDATSAIQTALNDCSQNHPDQVVYLQAGTYLISSTIQLRSQVVLRGAGPGQTTIKFNSANPGDIVMMSRLVLDFNHPDATYPITVANKDAQVITLTSTTGIAVGDILLINQQNDGTLVDSVGSNGLCNFCGGSGGTRSLGQFVEVTAVNGTQVSINLPLHWTYNPTLNPLASHFPGRYMIRWAGLEDLTLTQDSAIAFHEVEMDFTQYSWMKNVEIKNSYSKLLFLYESLQNEIRDCYFHDTVSTVGLGSGYGIEVGYNASNNLIVNNIFKSLAGGLSLVNASGNVAAYNYFDDLDFYDPTWMFGGPVLSHGAHSKMNLWEGNIGYKALADFVWGSSSHNTVFRSQYKGYKDTTAIQANNAVELGAKQLYYNFIGNVLGTPNIPIPNMTYRYEVNYGDLDDPYDVYHDIVIWHLGIAYAGFTGDPNVKPTLLRHGNHDYITNSTIWDPKISNHNLPASLYLSSKPSWWCQETPWPPIGPDVTGGTEDPAGHVYKIPAQRRFENLQGQNLPCTQGGTAPTVTPSPMPSNTPTGTPKPGDANGDLKVDGRDYVVWLNNYGQNISGITNGNFNGDAVVDGRDYVVWLNNYEK
jgi:hypothetical protein